MSHAKSLGGLAILVVGSLVLTAYLCMGILRLDPFAALDTVDVEMATSGGLQSGSTVLYNGVEVGRVVRIATSPGGLTATIEVKRDSRIPTAAQVRVANLSLVGEQYLEFSSDAADGPYLNNGAVLKKSVDPGVSVAEMLASMQGLTGQFDSQTLTELADTIVSGWSGRDEDLRIIGEFASRTARTVAVQRTEFSALFDHAQSLLGKVDDDRIGAVLRETAPKLAQMNIPFSTLWSLLPGLATATEGATGWYDVIIPFTQKIGEYMAQTMPDAAAIMRVLQPTLVDAAPAFRVDLATLVAQGLRVVDENGVLRLRVVEPR